MKYLVQALRHPRDYTWLELRPFQRHSLVLAVAGMVYIAIGTVYVVTEGTPQRAIALQLALYVAPLPVWGVLWISVGCLALLSARWPPASKTWGYSALTGLAACWSGVYLVGILLGSPTSGFAQALIFALVGFMWWAIAGLVNPDDLLAIVHEATNGGSDDDGES